MPRQRRFDSILVWKLDHCGRSVADCVRSIQEVAALGIRFVAMTQNIDTDESNPASRLLLHIFAAFAEFERELIRERVVTGIRATQGRCRRLGRPRRVFRRDQAVLLRAQGKSWREIAATLGVPFSTVIDACRAE
jgi:DNA invertase Pin-like site-specific DNA recombinase